MCNVSSHFMKQLFSGCIIILFSACAQKTPELIKGDKHDTVKVTQTSAYGDTMQQSTVADTAESAIYYIVEVAKGYNFDSLKNISANAVSILGSRFEMLDRIYKSGKGIIVPENDNDELYQGEYYPRRPFEDQNFVSIEMSFGFNTEEADTLKMVSIAGIYSLKEQADSVVSLLQGKIPTTKTVKRELYLGCMH
jgi:hypothetical protein